MTRSPPKSGVIAEDISDLAVPYPTLYQANKLAMLEIHQRMLDGLEKALSAVIGISDKNSTRRRSKKPIPTSIGTNEIETLNEIGNARDHLMAAFRLFIDRIDVAARSEIIRDLQNGGDPQYSKNMMIMFDVRNLIVAMIEASRLDPQTWSQIQRRQQLRAKKAIDKTRDEKSKESRRQVKNAALAVIGERSKAQPSTLARTVHAILAMPKIVGPKQVQNILEDLAAKGKLPNWTNPKLKKEK